MSLLSFSLNSHSIVYRILHLAKCRGGASSSLSVAPGEWAMLVEVTCSGVVIAMDVWLVVDELASSPDAAARSVVWTAVHEANTPAALVGLAARSSGLVCVGISWTVNSPKGGRWRLRRSEEQYQQYRPLGMDQASLPARSLDEQRKNAA